jgi:two-component system, LytTR family, response regulator
MTLRALIVDDESVARRRIRRLLQRETDVEVVGEAADGRSAVDAIRALAPDVVFLDVQMPEVDGFGVIAGIHGRLPAIVFVTAHDDYALRAFEVHALDYLLKPFTPERFADAVARVRARRNGADPDLPARLAALVEHLSAGTRYLSRIPARAGDRIRVIDVHEIDCIIAGGNYVRLMAGGREHLLRDTLEGLLAELDPQQFVRIHRSAIVRIDRVREFKPLPSGDCTVILRDGTSLTLSRTYRDRVNQALGRPL